MAKLARDPVDAHVGGQVKMRRGLVGMSQTELGSQLGITFQQVQKYEKGINRIGASRLYHISESLGVPVQYFFDGIEEGSRATNGHLGETEKYDAFMRSPPGIELCRSFVKIGDPVVRSRMMKLIKSVSE